MAAKADQSRMLQLTICYDRQKNWTFSISWGYSAHLCKKILPRSFLQNPIETFKTWGRKDTDRPNYMFNTRTFPVKDQSESPHVFFFQEVRKTSIGTLTTYTLNSSGESSVDSIAEIQVYSPVTKRIQVNFSLEPPSFLLTESTAANHMTNISEYNLICIPCVCVFFFRWIDVNAVILIVSKEAWHSSILGNVC